MDERFRLSLSSVCLREEHGKFGVFDKYEVITQVGKGSMGRVSVCRVKENAIGGSAVAPAEKKTLFSNFFSKPTKVAHEIIEKREKEVYYALKSIRLERLDGEMVQEIENEVSILRTLDHPNIENIFEVYKEKCNVYLVLEYCAGGDLVSRAPYSEKAAAKISLDLLSAVKYMHDHGIVHRTLKLENILFSTNEEDAMIKIIDFGLSKNVGGRKKHNQYMLATVGTIYTMAPQVISGKYDAKADLWSVGVIIYMILSQKLPFYHPDRRIMIAQINSMSYHFDSEIWKTVSREAQDIIQHLIVYNPKLRYDATQALSHKWFQELNDGDLSDEKKNIEICHAHALKNYKQLSEVKKMALYLIAHRSTTDEIKEINEMFRKYDKDNNGILSYDEFQDVFQALDYPADLVAEAFESFNLNTDSGIVYSEFVAATLEARHHVEEERIAEAFDRIDIDDDGKINREEISLILRDSFHNEEDIDSLFEQIDSNHDEQITYDEFLLHFREQSVKTSSALLFDNHDKIEHD